MLFAVVVLFAVNLLNYYDRNAPGALAEPMRREFTLSDTQIGIMGSAFIWLYALVGVPLGRLADIWSRKKLMAVGILIWTAFTALIGLANSYPMLLASRLGVGVGEAVCAPAGTSWLGDLYPANQRSRILTIFMLAFPIGSALGVFFSGPIAQAFGWRTAMMFAAAPALLLIPAVLLLQEPERGAVEVVKPVATGSPWRVLRIPTLWWIIASGAFLNFNMYALASFLPAFFSRVHKVSLGQSGIWVAFVYLVGGVLIGLVSGYWGDRIVESRKNGRMLLAAGFALISVPFWYVGMTQARGAVVVTWLCFAMGFGGLNAYYGLVYSAIQDVVGPAQRGFTMAIYFMAMYVCGAAFGPILTGTVSDRLARSAMASAGATTLTDEFRAIGLQQAMLAVPIVALLLALVLWLGSRTIVADMERRDLQVLEH